MADFRDDIDTLLKKLSVDNAVDVKALMLKKQQEQPGNAFWQNEQQVREWLQSKGKRLT